MRRKGNKKNKQTKKQPFFSANYPRRVTFGLPQVAVLQSNPYEKKRSVLRGDSPVSVLRHAGPFRRNLPGRDTGSGLV